MAKKYDAGVKDYRETYWMPDYTPKETDILACFEITRLAGAPRQETACPITPATPLTTSIRPAPSATDATARPISASSLVRSTSGVVWPRTRAAAR